MKTAELNAVYAEEIEEFLNSLGVLSEIKQGNKLCFYCQKPVEITDIVSIFPADNDVQVCCSSLQCYHQLLQEEF